MSLALTGQELSFQKRVKAFTEKHLKPLAAKIEAEEYFPRDFLRALGRNRFLGAPFSRSDGGLGLGWVCETIVAEEVSAVSAAAEMARLASAALYSAPLAYFGSSLHKRLRRSEFQNRRYGCQTCSFSSPHSTRGSSA